MAGELLAPVALFVYNRPEHTRRTLDALRANPEAPRTPLLVFGDGPRAGREGDGARVAEVRELFRDSAGFAGVECHFSEANRGLAASVIAGVGETVKRYGRVIVLEDDMVASRGFLRFMNSALELYADRPEVAAIHAYLPPLDGALPERCFLLPGADCWGWATWEESWALFDPDAAGLLRRLSGRTKEFDFYGCFPFTKMLADQARGKIDSWAIRWRASTFLAGKYMLQAPRNLVMNIGMDGSGAHCSRRDGASLTNPPYDGCVAVEPDAAPADGRLLEQLKRSYRRRRLNFWQKLVGKIGYEWRRRCKR